MAVSRWFHMGFLVTVSLVSTACTVGFDQSGSRALPDQLPPYTKWDVTSQGARPLNLPAAIDNMTATAAIIGRPYRGTSVTLNLGRPGLVNMVCIPHGPNEYGYARRVSLSTSVDGKNFEHRMTVSGTRRITYIYLGTPVRCQYIRLTADIEGSQPWTIAEIYPQ